MWNFRKWLESETTDTHADAYGTLVNYHVQFGIPVIPSERVFLDLLKRMVSVLISPERAVLVNNTSATKELIGKGLKDVSVVGMVDQRHDSWQSVLYHAGKQKNTPVVVVRHKGNLTLLDGDHRLVASVLMNRPILAKIIDI